MARVRNEGVTTVQVSRGWLEELERTCRTLLDLHRQPTPMSASGMVAQHEAREKAWTDLAELLEGS